MSQRLGFLVATAALVVACGGKVIVDEPSATAGAGGHPSGAGGAPGVGGNSPVGAGGVGGIGVGVGVGVGGVGVGETSTGVTTTGSGLPGNSVACVYVVKGITECFEYGMLTPTNQSQLEKECMKQPGGQIVAACPTTDLLGCCEVNAAGIKAVSCFYTQPKFTVHSVEKICTGEHGMFTTSPP